MKGKVSEKVCFKRGAVHVWPRVHLHGNTKGNVSDKNAS